MNDRCPHCKEVRDRDADPLFYSAADGSFCLVCGGEVEFNAKGRAVKVKRKPVQP